MKKIDTYSYKGWLNSDSFIKRSFACLGYQIVATLLLYLGILVVAIVGVAIGFGVSLFV